MKKKEEGGGEGVEGGGRGEGVGEEEEINTYRLRQTYHFQMTKVM